MSEQNGNKAHWENVYTTKQSDEVSWFQKTASTSLRIISNLNLNSDVKIIDVGSGASTFIDGLLALGYEDLTVLDLSAAALNTSKMRIGAAASKVDWIESDILDAEFSAQQFDVWHDRAVFHFLTDSQARQTYIEKVARAVKPGGMIIMVTFAEDGPEKCSGLPVMRYSANQLAHTFGDQFTLIDAERETHKTPWGSEQLFTYCTLVRRV